jgi:hypothetical protein
MAFITDDKIYEITKPYAVLNTLYDDNNSICKSLQDLDCYDLFSDYFLSLSPKKRNYLIEDIILKFNHPSITYMLKTTNSTNIYSVVCYLRSLKFYELYYIIEDIVNKKYNYNSE